MADFRKAAERVIALEGGYVFHPDDPGGETKFGITKRDYPDLDIKNLTREQAIQILFRDFWRPLRLDQVMDDEVAFEIVDTAFNGSCVVAARIAQRAVNALGSSIAVDGLVGPVTIAAINQATARDRDALLVTLNSLQCARYVRLTEKHSRYKSFFLGWVRHRVQLDPRLGAG